MVDYSWLNTKFDVYLDPLYYEEILPYYDFDGKSDEDILEEFLQTEVKKQGRKFRKVLELGCGSGRGTKIIQKYTEKLVAVDLNKDMIELSKKRYGDNSKITFHNEEMLEFSKKNVDLIADVDLVVSFWAINYSLNHEFAFRDPANSSFSPKDPEKGLARGMQKLEHLFNNIGTKAKFMLFHYDPTSEEQIIAHKCWKKIVPFPWGRDSPSLCVLEKFFSESKV